MTEPELCERCHCLSGWQVTNRTKKVWAVLPEEPTKFHRFIYSLGLEEKQVREALSGDNRRRIIEWARKNVDHCYVPTFLLEDAGIRSSRYES